MEVQKIMGKICRLNYSAYYTMEIRRFNQYMENFFRLLISVDTFRKNVKFSNETRIICNEKKIFISNYMKNYTKYYIKIVRDFFHINVK